MIRRLTVDDMEAFRELREEAMRLCPESFGKAEREQDNEQRDAAYRNCLKEEVWGAFEDGNLIGTAGYFIPPYARAQNYGQIFTVYVRNDYRRKGIGDRLLKTIIGLAEGRVDQAHLCVVHTAKAAIKLFLNNGFELFGTEPRAFSLGDIHYDELLMVKKFR